MAKQDKRATIKEVSRLAKVSTATVSMVMNGKPGVGNETRKRVLEVARELDYTPNLIARSLVNGRSQAIAMLITSTRNPVFPEIAAGIDEVLKQQGYSLSIISNFDDKKIDDVEIIAAKKRGLDGIITSAALLDGEGLIRLVDSGFPVVSVLRRVYGSEGLDYVIADYLKGAYIAAEHLIRMGHTRIGIIRGPQNTSTGIERFQGAIRALETYGMQVEEDLICVGDFFRKSGYEAASSLLKRPPKKRPTAIYACNDDMAIGAFEAIIDAGLWVGTDMALVGFNNTDVVSLRNVEITSVSISKTEMGRMAAKRIVTKIERLRGYKTPFKMVFEPKLVVRRSCGFSDRIGYVRKKRKQPVLRVAKG
jgi:LacI family transcriptional regulator, galactose operon repressor